MGLHMHEEIDVYVFSSDTITNIWAGYGASTWAVSRGGTAPAKVTKSARLTPGSFGILYCVPWQAFTVPFVTTTLPDTQNSETEIWSDEWLLPFRFRPLGSPRRRVAGKDLYNTLPAMKAKGITNFSHYLNVQSNFDFQPSKVAAEDWRTLIENLTDHA